MVLAQRDTYVIGLSPREQYCVKLLLSNLMSGYLDKTVQEASMIDSQEGVDKRTSITLNFFNRYNDFCDLLCPESMIGRAKPKVLLLKEAMMKYLVSAVNGYDVKNNYLGTEHRNMLANNFEALKKKVLDSAQHTYSKQEIEAAKK